MFKKRGKTLPVHLIYSSMTFQNKSMHVPISHFPALLSATRARVASNHARAERARPIRSLLLFPAKRRPKITKQKIMMGEN